MTEDLQLEPKAKSESERADDGEFGHVYLHGVTETAQDAAPGGHVYVYEVVEV